MKLYLSLIVCCFLSLQCVNAQEKLSEANKKEAKAETAAPLYILVLGGETYETKNYDRLNSIDPNDIESVNVLKNEHAISKYGDKGNDGVVEILLKANERSNELFKKFVDNQC